MGRWPRRGRRGGAGAGQRNGRNLRNFTLNCARGAAPKATKDTVGCSEFVSFVAFVRMRRAVGAGARGGVMAHRSMLRRWGVSRKEKNGFHAKAQRGLALRHRWFQPPARRPVLRHGAWLSSSVVGARPGQQKSQAPHPVRGDGVLTLL